MSKSISVHMVETDIRSQREAEIRIKYPFIPQTAQLTDDVTGTLRTIRLNFVNVVRQFDGTFRACPAWNVSMTEEQAIEMSAELLTAASIAKQLNAAIESERAIQEGA